ncbi:hypothetical protein J3B02_000939 [Coemansia erecta]|nr:hypothetical protein J3B02_000939 [Coemansia erecta]KAJ2888169.1 hypothetical protein FB639_000825 [Coemansia asiatica]
MTAYIDQCISNLTAGYLEELKKQEKWDQLELLCSHKNAEFNVSTLMSILQDMSMLQTLSPASITDTLSTQRSALTNRKKIKGHRQPHSESQRLVAENSTSSGTSEVKTIDWLLSSITHAPDTHCTLDSQHQLDKRDDGFFDIIKPYLQPEEPINSAQFSLNLLNQPASLLSPEAIGTPIYALSSEFAVCATDSASSEEVPNSSTSARTESTLVSMSSNIAASAGVQNLADQRVTFSQWQ